MRGWFPDDANLNVVEIADYDRVNNLGVFDIHVNGVLVHSRKCDTRTYGVPGHLWLRDNRPRENAVWQALNSSLVPCNSQKVVPQGGHVNVVVCSSRYGAKHSSDAAETIRSWFQNPMLLVSETVDDSSEWNFEIMVNGVLLHSMSTLGHGFFHDDWNQQSLVWRAMSDLLPSDKLMGA